MNQNSPNEVSDNLNGSARAIEVVTMLGDSVVGVEHLEPTRPAPSRRGTLALFLAGALLLALSAVAFAKGVSNAAANKAAYKRIADIDTVAARDFRPERLGLGWDFLAFGGLGLGVTALGLGLWRKRTRPARTALTCGRAADVDVAVDAVAAERMTLVRADAERTVLTVAPGMDARVRAGGVATTLADLVAAGQAAPAAGLIGGYELALPANGSARLTAGPATFVVRSVPVAQGRFASLASAVDRRAAAFLGGSALAHAVLLLILQWVPPSSKSLALDLGSGETRPTYISVQAPEDLIDDEEIIDDSSTGDDGAGGQSATAGDEGAAGTPESTKAAGKTRIARTGDVEQLSRETAIERARREGILGTEMAAEFRSLVGDAPMTSGWDKVNEYGHNGADGNSAGDFGASNKGDGPGGGGRDDVYRIGNDDLWKYPGNDPHTGVIKLPGRKKDKPTVTVVLGPTSGVDKDTIRRYIRRHLDRIRYAYEKQLLVNPSLAGTVVVQFTISPEGVVLNAKAKGLGGHDLEGAIAEIFRSIEFPKTSNGGVIAVTYPINLRTSAG
jgi:hypothetical protein